MDIQDFFLVQIGINSSMLEVRMDLEGVFVMEAAVAVESSDKMGGRTSFSDSDGGAFSVASPSEFEHYKATVINTKQQFRSSRNTGLCSKLE
jgi:hypothetical protein